MRSDCDERRRRRKGPEFGAAALKKSNGYSGVKFISSVFLTLRGARRIGEKSLELNLIEMEAGIPLA